ncbi:NPCBM/NEW2 domain-containing protein [Paenibacillus sp. GCM10023252]|uniref:NPCBM/NEW2 domain-containing protein n=1 Tax=Paenibacillus sp. GCM10023252 TaxID=3252649 RepID=UPI003622594F
MSTQRTYRKMMAGMMAWLLFFTVFTMGTMRQEVAYAAETTYISDLSWTTATTGFGTVQKDKSIDGNTITLNGVTYTKGLGTHAASTITYTLNNGYTRFVSDVGIDDEQNPWGGTVVFQVWADGTKLYDSGVMNNTTPTKTIDVNITGKTQLQLIATDAGDGNSSDHADWAGARVINDSTGGTGTGTGLRGEYYDNADLTNSKLVRTDNKVEFDWVNGSPDPLVGSDTFSVRWTGQVQAQTSEVYTFYTNTDDGARLWVNNQLIIDKWVDQSPTEWSGSVSLAAGQKMDIKLEYYENGYGAAAKLYWSTPTIAKQIIPQSQLYAAQGGSGGTGGSIAERYMGINIEHPSDSSNLKIFANAYKTVRIGSPNSPADYTFPVDSSGDPYQDFGLFMWDAGGFINDTQGSYAISFNGQATVAVTLGDASIPGGISYNSATNTSSGTMVVNTNSTVSLKFTNTKRTSSSAANTGVTNMKIMRPVSPGSSTSYPASTVFSDTFKNIIKNEFKAKAIRFMDFTATNGKTGEVQWSDRVTPAMVQSLGGGTGYGWQGKGGAWEYIVMLCNELDVDAWISVPTAVNDDYITKLAQLFKYGTNGVTPYTSTQANPVYPGLEAGRKLYVEYSNELWNTAGAFTQSTWNKDQAVAEVNAGGSILNYDGTTNVWQLGWRRQAKRTVEISNAFRAVFGDSEMMTRIRPVLEWQQGDGQGTAGTMLSFIDNWYSNKDGNHVAVPRPVNYFIWGGSGSAYYSPDNHSDTLSLTNFWSNGDMDPATWANAQKIDASWAAMFGLKRTAYEGGPSLDNTGHSESVKLQAWNDSRMTAEVTEHQQAWEQYGGDILMYFTFSALSNTGYYQWEFVKDMNNPVATSPKLAAIKSLADGAKEAVTYGIAVPGSASGDSWVLNSRGWGTPTAGGVTLRHEPDQYGSAPIRWTSYNFKTSAAGSVTPSFTYSASNAAQVEVHVDGNYVSTLTTSGTSGQTLTYTAAAVGVPGGLHSVRLYCKTGPIQVSQVSLN